MAPPLFLDLGAVPSCHCDNILDDLFKAITEAPAGAADPGIWAPHHDPWQVSHVEQVTARLRTALDAIRDTIARALRGEPVVELRKAEVPWLRWAPEQFEATRARLEAKPTVAYTLDDWGTLVDYLIQLYLPEGVIRSEAQYLSVRAQLLGKVSAAMGDQVLPDATIGLIATLIPTDAPSIPLGALTAIERGILDVSQARAAQFISDLTESTRARMKRLVIRHVEAQVLGTRGGTPGYLERALFDEFAILNRDCRRIAVTEVGECYLQGFVAAQRPGTRLRRQEAYKGACDWCRSINGKVFTVVEPTATRKDGATEVWLGKTNAGRSASPRRREGGLLVERVPAERWWCAAGLQHPHCRGTWTIDPGQPPPGVKPEFAQWMAGLLAQGRPEPPPP